MIVYEIIEDRYWNERYRWGIFSSEENAKIFLKQKGWNKYQQFKILSHIVDEKLNK